MKKRWPASSDLWSKVQKDKEKNPKTGPDKNPDDVDKKTRQTCVGGHNRAAKTKDREQLEGQHMFHTTMYGSEDLLGMNAKVSTVKGTTGGKVQMVEALADSEDLASIITWDLAKKLNMVVFGRGDATFKDASHRHMVVSGKDEIIEQEEHGLPHKIKVLVSKELGQDELVVGLEDLKDIGILHKEFPKTLSERRREDAKQASTTA